MTNDDDRIRVLVLGLGDVRRGDAGAGVIAVHRVRREWIVPAWVRVVDGDTLGLDLLALLAASERVILVDAVRASQVPGTLVRLSGDQVAPAVRARLSAHQVEVADILPGGSPRERYPREVVIVGVVPATTELQLGCTPDVAASLDGLVDAVIAELRRLGASPVRRDSSLAAQGDGVRALGS